MRGVPGITRRAIMANDAAASVSKFVQVKFAQQDGPSLSEPPHDFRIFRGNEMF